MYSNSHVHDTSKLSLEIYIDHMGRGDERVGKMEETLAALLSEQCKYHYSFIAMADTFGIAVHHKLEKQPGSKKPQSTIEFHIGSTGTDPTAPEVHQAQENVEKLSFVPFPDLVGKADTFLKLVAGIFEVHIFTAEYMM